MARFLLACWSFDTHSDVFLAVGQALRSAGHEVAVYTAPRLLHDVESIGARFYPFAKLSQEQADSIVVRVLQYRRRPWRLWRWWRQFLLETIPDQVDDLTAAIADFSPDAIIADNALWSVTLILREMMGLPAAILSHIGFCLQPGDSGPIHGPAMPPRRTRGQRLLAGAIEALSGYSVRDARRLGNRLRARYGLAPQTAKMTELLGKMDLYLIPGCPTFDYSRSDLPASVRYVGCCEWPPGASDPSAEANRRPRVLVEEGTLYPEESKLLCCAVEGLGNKDMDVAIMPGKGRAIDFHAPASNIEILPWAPVQTILSSYDLVVSNGNSNSVLSALARGVPLLVVPSILDQSEIAVRVEQYGAGLRLSERACTPAGLAAAVDRLLHSREHRSAALRIAGEIRSLRGPAQAVAHLEDMVSSKSIRPDRLTPLGGIVPK